MTRVPTDHFATPKDYDDYRDLPENERKKIMVLRRYWRRELERYFAGGKYTDWWPQGARYLSRHVNSSRG